MSTPLSLSNTWLNIRALEHCSNSDIQKVRVQQSGSTLNFIGWLVGWLAGWLAGWLVCWVMSAQNTPNLGKTAGLGFDPGAQE